MTLDARYFLLKKEIERNPVKTVIIDMSYETLTRIESEEHAEGNSVTFAKLDSLSERMKFLIQSVPLNDWPYIYTYHFLPDGLEYAIGIIRGNVKPHNVEYSEKGFLPRKINNIEFSKKEAVEQHNSKQLNTNFRKQNQKKLEKIIELCKKNKINIILAVAPVSDTRIWEETEQDKFLDYAKKFSKKQECVFLDFNLLKNRYELFNDKESFFDVQHMSEKGANIFTKEFCNIIKKSETEDVSKYFYDSYEDMKKDSPYMKYLN